MLQYITLEKRVGETPLSCAETWRAAHPRYADTPLAYAGRLDPMASGKLLILIGEECKKQAEYHRLDKEYEFSILFGIESDSLDVLGRLTTCTPPRGVDDLAYITTTLIGDIALPYPRFSAKTVRGKPLHMWTLEGRLDEIEIPTRTSTIYSLQHTQTERLSRETICHRARTKIDTIPPVTDERKALGADFRRDDIRADWERIGNDQTLPETYHVATFTAIASSGSYMRSLAALIAARLGSCGLAWHIHRTRIGHYAPETERWDTEY